jgi:hypothetical protein
MSLARGCRGASATPRSRKWWCAPWKRCPRAPRTGLNESWPGGWKSRRRPCTGSGAFGLQPWRTGDFKISPDPLLIDKVRDIIGLCLAPPAGAAVFAVDENRRSRRWNGPTPASSCTSPPPTPPGSARSNDGSPNCSAAAWTAAYSARSTTSPRRWKIGSRSGTPAPGPSNGPRPPTRSSTASAATAHASPDRDTSPTRSRASWGEWSVRAKAGW